MVDAKQYTNSLNASRTESGPPNSSIDGTMILGRAMGMMVRLMVE
jgi:hypothetical protein